MPYRLHLSITAICLACAIAWAACICTADFELGQAQMSASGAKRTASMMVCEVCS